MRDEVQVVADTFQIANEVDENGIEHKRGLKTMTIPAHTRENCQDILVKCVKFILPEDLDVSDTTTSICNERNLKARFIQPILTSRCVMFQDV